MPPGPSISISVTCYRGGFVGFIAYFLVELLITRLWGGYAWYASRSGSLYFLMGSITSVLTPAVQYCLTVFYNSREPLPYGPIDLATFQCRSEYKGLYPDLLTALLYHFWILGLSHEIYLTEKMPRMAISLGSVGYLIVCPLIIYVTKNASLPNLAYGALIGTGNGLLCGALLAFIFVPMQQEMSEYTKWIGYASRTDVLSGFRVLN